MKPKEAASRRDFTINSISKDIDGNIIDPFNGQEDLKNGILRATSEKFSDDPLRALRGFQFAGRFNMKACDFTQRLCMKVLPEAENLSKERVREEIC